MECPNPLCGQDGFSDPGPCLYCCYVVRKRITLSSRRNTAISSHRSLKMSQLMATKHYPEDIGFWDRENQYTIEKEEEGWKLVPNTHTEYLTLCNQEIVRMPILLSDGDEIAILDPAQDIHRSIFFVSIS